MSESTGMTREEALTKRVGDQVRIRELWPRGGGGSQAIEDSTPILAIKHERSQTGVNFKVDQIRGTTVWLDAGWFHADPEFIPFEP